MDEATGAAAPVAVTWDCTGCGACLLTCPEHAIRPHGRPLDILPGLCTGCLECIEVCPADAIVELAEQARSAESAVSPETAVSADPAVPAERPARPTQREESR